MKIEFLLNGEAVSVEVEAPTRTLLDWLRENRGLKGTKEGCNEGDCGACSVLVTSSDENGSAHLAMNACILFLPQLHGKAVRTVEGLAEGDTLHPVQQAMVDHHGSQCGFCTPGFVMSMTAAHQSGNADHNDTLAGNLCRCTGYEPIIKAAKAAEAAPVSAAIAADATNLPAVDTLHGDDAFIPTNLAEFAHWYQENPNAILIGGATDVGLWVNKAFRDITPVAFLSQIPELRVISETDTGLRIGAGVTLNRLRNAIKTRHPDFATLIRRYGSTQVRNAATIGGNVANGSPIGDSPPALIALNARIRLQKGDTLREIPIEDFFVAYGKQDRTAGEFVESILIPPQEDRLKCYKLSKRFDQDISTILGCFSIPVKDGIVHGARLAFGGMAATPKRAIAVENALNGQPWNEATIRKAMACIASDFQPIADVRGSREYRLRTAENLLLRYFLEDQGERTRVLEERP